MSTDVFFKPLLIKYSAFKKPVSLLFLKSEVLVEYLKLLQAIIPTFIKINTSAAIDN